MYGAVSLISLIISPIITQKPWESSESSFRLAWNLAGALTMACWSALITFVVFAWMAYFDVIAQTDLFLNGIDKNHMNEAIFLDLGDIENRHGGIKKAEYGSLEQQKSLKTGLSPSKDVKIHSDRRFATISPHRPVSTTSSISTLAPIVTREESDKSSSNINISSRTHLLSNVMKTNADQTDVPISERYAFPRPPCELLMMSDDMKLINNSKALNMIKNDTQTQTIKNKSSRASLRPQIKIVPGDESDLSSLPRSPYENMDSPRANHQRFISLSVSEEYHTPRTSNTPEDVAIKFLPLDQSTKKSDKTRNQSLSNLAIHNQMKMLKPLPSSLERRPSLAARRSVTPIEKYQKYTQEY